MIRMAAGTGGARLDLTSWEAAGRAAPSLVKSPEMLLAATTTSCQENPGTKGIAERTPYS